MLIIIENIKMREKVKNVKYGRESKENSWVNRG